eukprot:c25835_g1_i1.p1 GENE.c25835_g1_i1~~c25835_g1_i1.p1  ORF type:complete len:325 (-),score=58.41 c25835_g1_i1:136-1074(-)
MDTTTHEHQPQWTRIPEPDFASASPTTSKHNSDPKGPINFVPESPPQLCSPRFPRIGFSFENLPTTAYTDLELPPFFVHPDPAIFAMCAVPPLIELQLFVRTKQNDERTGPLQLTKRSGDSKIRRKLFSKSLTFPLSIVTQISGVVIPHDSFCRGCLYEFLVVLQVGDDKISSWNWFSDSFQIKCKKSATNQKLLGSLTPTSTVECVPKIDYKLARRLAGKDVSAVIGHQITTVQHLMELTLTQQVQVHECIFRKKSQLTLEKFILLITSLRTQFDSATQKNVDYHPETPTTSLVASTLPDDDFINSFLSNN